MKPFPPIPTPPRRRLMAFATEILPFVVFGIGVLAAAVLWSHSTSPTLVAEAESIASDVRSAHPGQLTALEVALLQPVKAGQVIARVRLADPAVLAASLAMTRAEIALMRANLDPVLPPAQRLALDASRLQLDWMNERVTLASLKVQLQLADAELTRLTPLHDKHLVSDEAFDVARHARENAAVRLTEQTKLIDALTPAASEFAARRAEITPASAQETLAAAIRVQEEKLRLTEAQLGATELTAPLEGVVSVVHRRAGEMINAGEPVVTIAAASSARIIGYLRQPVLIEPKAGMKVELRTRNLAHQTAEAQIVEVGRIMEPVPPTVLALLNRANALELGLRLHIAMPAGLALRPGEQVDVTIR